MDRMEDKIQELVAEDMPTWRIAEYFDVSERTARRWKAKYKTGQSQVETAEIEKKCDTYVITAAVNATKTHNGFLASLRTYCDANDAKLIVLPMRYRNPTRKEETPADWWCPKIAGDLLSERTKIANGLVLLADIKIQPTAINPLQGWLTVSGSDSAIIGHTKVALQSVPTRVGDPAKLVMTTGACTVPQYSDTNAGKKGELHHVLGAVIVEVDGRHNHIRHILGAHDGSFIDLDKKYTRHGYLYAPRATNLTLGDVHAYQVDQKVLDASEKLAGKIRPESICAHDVLDFSSASHHSGYFERFAAHQRKRNSVLKELEVTAEVLERISGWADETIIIGSNHNEHMTQWLAKHENALDLENALVYHETKGAMLRSIHEGEYLDPFKHWMDKMMRNPQSLKWLKPGEHFIRHKIDYSAHGHKGPNGARGSTKAFANIGAKTVTGHSHSPAIIDGAYTVGTTSKLKLGYNLDSPSSWHQTHCITYANGKRALIHCVAGKFYR